jgi:hypothetical protein
VLMLVAAIPGAVATTCLPPKMVMSMNSDVAFE